MHFRSILGACAIVLSIVVSTARADFAGQPILGPLVVNGAPVAGNTAGHADDNDGWDSGTHIFDLWTGPDDVWQVNWPGGDMQVTMTGTGGADLDLFLYEPGSYDSSGNYEITGSSNETLFAPASAAGIYYLNIDSESAPGSYTIAVSTVPEPTSLALAASGLALLARRRFR